MVDPNEFIITRRRKKYKFAHFANYENCFEVDAWQQFDIPHDKGLIVELGAGTGLFVLELARRHPENFYVAIDVKADRLYTAAKQALDEKLDNVVFLRAHAEMLPDLFIEGAVDELWLTFSDPFPKKRHAKHRLTNPKFLALYRKLLRENGQLKMKTDNHSFFDWSLEQFVADGWQLNELSYDLHQSKLADDYKIMTNYETGFVNNGQPIYLVVISK